MASGPSQPDSGITNNPSLKIDESKLSAHYANFCRVVGTPEEVIVDFGLNTQPQPTDDAKIALSERVVLNYFTAKRLLQALGATVARYEQAFGTLEINIGKRLEKK